MHIHHHVKHGARKVALFFKGKIRISLLFLSLAAIFYFSITYVFNKGFTESLSPQQTLSESTLNALNLHAMASDEFAIVTKRVGNQTGKKVTKSIALSSGGI